uniref:PHD-type domain-containing protein n=1 Tax=Xiphophorus couchianus TaxID=32473 RepID=A0A3B5L3Z3_9TELE
PALFGEKVKLEEHNFSVHYFCLLTSSGVYQRGEENEGVFGFLVDDIKQEVRRAARMTCYGCKKKGACIGCNVSSCRRVVHFPCGRKLMFITQSYCQDHSPTQSLCVDSDFSLPQSCSICLDSIEPVLSYSVLKCPSCHASWFHRDCVQHQAHSAGLFFFRCTLCNNKENFQQEMVRMGIYIPERWFEVIRCCLCGSRGTHRKCSNLKLDTTDWACIDCINATDGKGWFSVIYVCIHLHVFSSNSAAEEEPGPHSRRLSCAWGPTRQPHNMWLQIALLSSAGFRSQRQR